MSEPVDTSPAETMKIDEAVERLLDAVLHLVEGKDNDDLLFLESFFQELASEMNVTTTIEMDPMTAGQFRERWRDAKSRLANGGRS